MRFDLKELLLVSMSTSPNGVIRRHKRFNFGKIRRTPSLASRLHRRRRLLKRILHGGSASTVVAKPPFARVDGCTQTCLQHNSIAVGVDLVMESATSQTPHQDCLSSQVDTADLICTNSAESQTHDPDQQFTTIAVGTTVHLDSSASQTRIQECITSHVDTSDLIIAVSKDQQTFNPEHGTFASQTDSNELNYRTSQTELSTMTITTQTKLVNACLGIQATVQCTDATVQTNVDHQHTSTQTSDDEEIIIKPHIQALYLIQESIQNQSDLIQNEVLEAVNQLVDITMLQIKQIRMELDLPREASLESMTPNLSSQIGDSESRENLSGEAETKKDSFKLKPKYRIVRFGKRCSIGPSWYCTMKCKSCGLHMHRTRQRVPSENHETQTEEEKTKEAVVMDEVATQTSKDRVRWNLMRS
uniref:AT22836p n=1 Tax=Drosophila melanogaster TaxID=7227 RepID=Q8T411_DROME|nr:AT22836p [Drosophila melanogaster]